MAYLTGTALNLWIFHSSLLATGVEIPTSIWWKSWAVFFLLLNISWIRPRSRIGQITGAAESYFFAAQPIFLYASLPASVLLLLSKGSVQWFSVSGYIAICFFAGSAAVFGIGCCNGKTVQVKRYNLETCKQLSVPVLRIIHLSDLHLGFINKAKDIRQLVQRVNRLSPDLVCITGDTFTESIRTVRDPNKIAAELSSLQSRFGTFACLGNHDAGRDFVHMLHFFQNAGIRVLIDEHAYPLDGVCIIGRSDASPSGIRNKKRPNAAENLSGIGENEYRIVLDHQPMEIDAIQKAGADLLLCGHTHGGQFFPASLFIRKKFPHYTGIQQNGSLYTIVNAGSGAATPPIRLGTCGEITCIEIRSNEKKQNDSTDN